MMITTVKVSLTLPARSVIQHRY